MLPAALLLQPPTSGMVLWSPAIDTALASPIASEPLSAAILDQVYNPSQPPTSFSPSGLVTWPRPTLTTALSMSSMLSSHGMSTLASHLMGSHKADSSVLSEVSSAPMAFDLHHQSCQSLSHSYVPFLTSFGTQSHSATGINKSLLPPLPSHLPVSSAVARSHGIRCPQPSFSSAPSHGMMTMPSSSYLHQRPTLSDWACYSSSPRLEASSVHMQHFDSFVPQSGMPAHHSLASMMATRHSCGCSSSSICIWLSPNLALTCHSMQDTHSVKVLPPGQHHKESMPRPSSTIDMLTAWPWNNVHWLPWLST